jgi:hypothetical protein
MPDPKMRPTSVILLGHSMGGVVARSIFAAPNYAHGTVRTILTLNSPHISAPLLFHRGVYSFYSRVNDMWRLHCDDHYELQQTAVVSIAGGLRDTQVHASLSNLDSIIPCKNHISAISTSIPDVWISMDHTSCMWCHQLTSVISAALAGLLDPATGQAHESLSHRIDNLKRYFESTVPAALHLDSPTPLATPKKVLLEPTTESFLATSDEAIAESSSIPSTSSDTSSTKDLDHGITISQHHHQQQQQQTVSDDAANAGKISWVAAIPIETKKTTVRVSGWHKLANFQVKWDLFQHTQLSNLQILTTVPLDDLNVLLCDPSGRECLDLTQTAAPIPYSIRQTGPHGWQTLKAHVIVTHLKDYSLAGYRFVVVSSMHKAAQPTHNHGVYKGEYGPEIFMVAQLTDPLEIITMNGNWISDAEYSLGQHLVSHMSLLDANKYLLYHAKVVRNECNTHPLFTPLILEYSPALREERYEQNNIALRFHEQFLSYNYRRTVSESVSVSKQRVPMSSQEGLHVFIFADPVCSHSLVLTPDWAASVDVVLRNFGVLIIGGFAVLAVMVTSLQIQHAESNPNKSRKRVFSIVAYILTSPWIVVLVALYSMPVRFPDFFESLASPWLRNHSFAMMSRPWPAPLIVLILIVASLVALAGWSTAVMILFYVTHYLPDLVRRALRHVWTKSGSGSNGAPFSVNPPSLSSSFSTNPPNPTPSIVSHHRRNPSIELPPGTWPGAWCISKPGTAIVLFLFLTLSAFFLHSAFVVMFCLLLLALPLNNEFPMNPQAEESMFHFRHAVFVLYSPSLILLIPDMLVWINNMHFEYQILDSYERFAILLAVHVVLIRFTSPNVILQRSSLRLHWLLNIIVVFMALYCLFPVYRTADALFFAAVCFVFDHVFKIFSTSPQDRFLKAH